MDEAFVYNAAKSGKLEELKIFFNGQLKDDAAVWVAARTDGTTPLLIACQNGHLDLCLFLIKKCEVDVEQVGCVTLDGLTMKGAPPLWCAAGTGQLKLVKTLISYGARVDSTTQTYSTPLRIASIYGHFEVVKYLVKHGADVELSNDDGNTSLMGACCKGHYEIVKFLLESGAYVNRRNVKGKTALHRCADSGNLEILKLLVKYGAMIYKDELGCTPLVSAAAYGCQSIVEYFVKEDDDCPKVSKVTALELLGATFIDRDRDISAGISCWRRAMKLRYEDTEGIALEKPDFYSPISYYVGPTEVRSFYQLEELVDNPDEMRIQSLLVRYRILGPTHPETIRYFKYRGAVYASNDNFKQCISIWMCSLDVLRHYHEPLSSRTRSCVLDFINLFTDMINEDYELFFRDVLRVSEIAVLEIERASESHEYEGQDLSLNNNFHRNVIAVMHLVGVMCRMEPCLDEDERIQVRKIVYGLVAIDPIVHNGSTLLHLACLPEFPTLDRIYSPFPSFEVIDLLLHVGACSNSVDLDKNTPLHIAAMNIVSDRDIIQLLLDNGSHLDARNCHNRTPLQMLLPKVHMLNIYPLQHINLQCLCARVIIDHKISYEGLVHEDLYAFLDSHSSA